MVVESVREVTRVASCNVLGRVALEITTHLGRPAYLHYRGHREVMLRVVVIKFEVRLETSGALAANFAVAAGLACSHWVCSFLSGPPMLPGLGGFSSALTVTASMLSLLTRWLSFGLDLQICLDWQLC